jgi:hypothetical protein
MNERREVCFLIGAQDVILWADASGDPVALPDRRSRWEAIWDLREQIVEIAHTHPLGGAAFSTEDQTTMQALDSALGRKLRYAVVTPDVLLRRVPSEDGPIDRFETAEPWWTTLIRLASGIELDLQQTPRKDS